MNILTLPPYATQEVHHAFAAYLSRMKNTICGRHLIGVLLGAMIELEGGVGRYEEEQRWRC
ncbi:hypothetical protein DFH11DRAFT_1569030 [Phellopilus nigrolimitatus]|nr:hypothetical protein DFH11DRAFT_1569030 [Phellopilus nigrolimitatus]